MLIRLKCIFRIDNKSLIKSSIFFLKSHTLFKFCQKNQFWSGPRVIESLPPSYLFKQQAALHIWNYFREKELWSSPKLPNLSASMEGHRLPARLPNFENQKCIFPHFEMYLPIYCMYLQNVYAKITIFCAQITNVFVQI